jgi:hypothetical protein
MSRSEWEKGTIVIPTALWAGFKKGLRDAYNAARTKDFVLAQQLMDAIKTAQKGKRNVDWDAVFDQELVATVQDWTRWGRTTQRKYPFQTFDQDGYDLKPLLLLRVDPNDSRKLRLQAPKKKDFALATNKTMQFSAGDGDIALQEAAHAVYWRVRENNHAVEYAHEHPMARVLFALLAKVKWTRGSGGHLFGNDENNEHSGEEGSGLGGSYITHTFGPLGEKARDLAFRCG